MKKGRTAGRLLRKWILKGLRVPWVVDDRDVIVFNGPDAGKIHADVVGIAIVGKCGMLGLMELAGGRPEGTDELFVRAGAALGVRSDLLRHLSYLQSLDRLAAADVAELLGKGFVQCN